MKIKKGTVIFLLLLVSLLWAEGKYLGRLSSSVAWQTMLFLDQIDQNRFGFDSFEGSFKRTWVGPGEEAHLSLSQALVVQAGHRISRLFHRTGEQIPILMYQILLGGQLIIGALLVYFAGGGRLGTVLAFWLVLLVMPWNLIPIYPLTEKPLSALLVLVIFGVMSLVSVWPKRAWIFALMAAHVAGFYVWSETGSMPVILSFMIAATYWWSRSQEEKQAQGIFVLFFGLVCFGFMAVFSKDLSNLLFFQQTGDLPFTEVLGIPSALLMIMGLGCLMPLAAIPWKQPNLRETLKWRVFVSGVILIVLVVIGKGFSGLKGDESGLYSVLPLFLVVSLVGWSFLFQGLQRPMQALLGLVLVLLLAGVGWEGYQAIRFMQVYRNLEEIRKLAQVSVPVEPAKILDLLIQPNGAPEFSYQLTQSVYNDLVGKNEHYHHFAPLVGKTFETKKAFVAALNGLDSSGLWAKKVEVSPSSLEIGSRRDYPGNNLESIELPKGQAETCWSMCLVKEGCEGVTYEWNLGFGRSRCNLKSVLPTHSTPNGCCLSVPVGEMQVAILTDSSQWNQAISRLKRAANLDWGDEKSIASVLADFPSPLVMALTKKTSSTSELPRLVAMETDPQKRVIQQSIKPLSATFLSPPELLALGHQHRPFVLLKSFNHQTFNSPAFMAEERKIYLLEVARYKDQRLSQLRRFSNVRPYGPVPKNQWWVVPQGSIPHSWFKEQHLGYGFYKPTMDKFKGNARFKSLQWSDSVNGASMSTQAFFSKLERLKEQVFPNSRLLMEAAFKGAGLWSIEPQLDYPNQQLSSVELPANSEILCRQTCAAEQGCVAYTYEPKIIETPGASRCNLKKAAYIAVSNHCCSSGQKVQSWVDQYSDLTAELEGLLRRYATEPVSSPQELLAQLEADWGKPLPEVIRQKITNALTPAVFGLEENINQRQIENAEVLKGVSLLLVKAEEIPGLRKKLKTFDLVLDWRRYPTLFRLTYPAYKEFYQAFGERSENDYVEMNLPSYRNYQLANAEEVKNTLATTFLGWLSSAESKFIWDKSPFSFGSAGLESVSAPYWPLDYEVGLLRLSQDSLERLRKDPALGGLAPDLGDLVGKTYPNPESLLGVLESKWGEAKALWTYSLLLPYWLEENPKILGSKSVYSLSTWYRSFRRTLSLGSTPNRGREEIEVLIYRPQ